MSNVPPDAELVARLTLHAEHRDVGERHCRDCRLLHDRHGISAISIARYEYAHVEEWIMLHRYSCIYCGGIAQNVDHLVPEPYTGPVARRFVPTVPACGDCNRRISDAAVFTIAGRSEIAGGSLRRKWERKLRGSDMSAAELGELLGMLRVAVESNQHARREIRRRLMVLDAGGAPFVSDALLLDAA